MWDIPHGAGWFVQLEARAGGCVWLTVSWRLGGAADVRGKRCAATSWRPLQRPSWPASPGGPWRRAPCAAGGSARRHSCPLRTFRCAWQRGRGPCRAGCRGSAAGSGAGQTGGAGQGRSGGMWDDQAESGSQAVGERSLLSAVAGLDMPAGAASSRWRRTAGTSTREQSAAARGPDHALPPVVRRGEAAAHHVAAVRAAGRLKGAVLGGGHGKRAAPCNVQQGWLCVRCE